VDDVLSSLYEALSPPEFDQTVQLQFGERRAWISEICKLPALYASLKASRISGVLDRHIHQMKIVVGARPIFLTNRDEIFSMEIHSSMSLVTSDAAENEEHHTFNLTLEEINNLIRECEAAKKKIDALQEKFEGVVSVKVRL